MSDASKTAISRLQRRNSLHIVHYVTYSNINAYKIDWQILKKSFVY